MNKSKYEHNFNKYNNDLVNLSGSKDVKFDPDSTLFNSS